MRTGGGSVGRRGIALLFLTGVAGVILAAHGWSGRQSGLGTGGLAGPRASVRVASHGPPSPAGSPSPHSSPAAGAGGGKAAPAGPLLRAQSFAPYSFLVWPGTPSAAAKTALTGLSISVRRTGSGIAVTAGVVGQPRSAPRTYPGGARVYVVEASLGDEAGNSDYNLGDDGLVVTDAQGRILR